MTSMGDTPWLDWPELGGDGMPPLPDHSGASYAAASSHRSQAYGVPPSEMSFSGLHIPQPSKGLGAVPAHFPLPGLPGMPLPEQQGLLQPAQSLPNPEQLGQHSGPFTKAPTTSLDAFLELDPQAMGRAASLPSRSARSSHSPSSQQPPETSAGIDPMDFRTRLLQAMPMGRSSAGAGKGRSFAAAETSQAAKARAKAVDNESEAAHRLKNRDAQRRFRQRQRDSITGAQKAVDELSKKMRDLAWDVQQERVSARVIMESLLLEDKHIKRLAALPEVRAAEQQAMLQRFMDLVRRTGCGTSIGGDVLTWRVRDWIEWFGKDFVPQMGRWVAEAEGGGEAGQKLREVVTLRRENLARVARFSCWNWILYAWNVEASRSVPPGQLPTLETAVRLLAALNLSKAQLEKLLKAHNRLRQQYALAAVEKPRVVEALERGEATSSCPAPSGDSLDMPQHSDGANSSNSQDSGRTQYGGFQVEGVDWGPQGPGLRALRRYLEGERWATYNFLHTVLDETLTPEQEAKLDCMAYPFQPDWHTMLCVAALQQVGQRVTQQAVDAMALPNLDVDSPIVQPLLPAVRASQLLLRPTTALGIGGRLSYGILLNPYQTVDDAQLWVLPPCSKTSGMLMKDAVSGSWQIGLGAPLYWFGLEKMDQDPCALEPHEKALIKQQLSQRLSLVDSASSEALSSQRLSAG